LVCVLAAVGHALAVFLAPTGEKMKRWEYRVFTIRDEKDMEILNQLGRQAWEAVGFSGNSNTVTILLKRLISD
jgi:hypothetical protein